MRLLFVHHGFPGQYIHLAKHYAARPENKVVGVGDKANLLRQKLQMPGVELLGYDTPRPETSRGNTYDGHVLQAITTGRVVAHGAEKLKQSGFRPDVVLAHIGWGGAAFLKEIFPEAPLLLYCEFFYRAQGADTGFDPEFPKREGALGARTINAPLLMALDASDHGVTPTKWQHRQFPSVYRPHISVVHDGIDTDVACPAPDAGDEEIVTYVARNLEPYRGFHVFMRAIPEIQRRRPAAKIVIVGADSVSYSPPPPPGETYRSRLLRELDGKIDLSRVFFRGTIPYPEYLALLRRSSVHVYLTYPFVLSWSLLEAMSAGCLVVGSRTPPVQEVITHGKNGLLVDFHDPGELAARVDEALRAKAKLKRLRNAARRTVVDRYDLKRVCLPAQVRLVRDLAAGRLRPASS